MPNATIIVDAALKERLADLASQTGQGVDEFVEALLLSPRALGLVVEWASAHRQELVEDWQLARQQQPLKRIAPLE
jgi:hypothetical protein